MGARNGLKAAGLITKASENSGSRGIIALAGNPNVGKSTVFNKLTGLNQHTGNWPGKTVGCAYGTYKTAEREYTIIDLPGTYSLSPSSPEEEVTRDFLMSGAADACIIVCDATCLERNLYLVLRTLSVVKNAVICLNLMDEAVKKGFVIDAQTLEKRLGTPVAAACARSGGGLRELTEKVAALIDGQLSVNPPVFDSDADIIKAAESICAEAVHKNAAAHDRDRRLDKILTGRFTGMPVMLLLLGAVFWLTITGTNIPSDALMSLFQALESRLTALFELLGAPEPLHGALVLGVYRVVAWVVAVMLPPMAIFFPIFTLLEDFGYLPRVAFNLDYHFKKAHTCGKQGLTMCMGFGCNAAGVVGCRIIDSPRERLIAIITNSFVPCNGRFPTLIAVITMFFLGSETGGFVALITAAILAAFVVFSVVLTFVVSRFLSATFLKGQPSSFVLELPPYRMPQFGKVIVRSVFDRTLFVLARAVKAAAPAGLIIWLLANLPVDGVSLLSHCSAALDPFAAVFGLDGVILLAFILGFPANEIVMPIIIMTYISAGTVTAFDNLGALHELLLSNGWTVNTAVCVMLFTLTHWPCAAACQTVKKETGSYKWTLLAFFLPAVIGFLSCFIFTAFTRIIT